LRRFCFLLMLAGLISGCNKDKPSQPYPNRPPETRLFLVLGDSLGVPDTTAMPDTTTSMKILYWYGDDPDGEVIGYQWAWQDTQSPGAWTFTPLTMDTFYVPIRQQFDFFTFFVRAMDNDSALDPTPAAMTFPIVNSPPWVRFPAAFSNIYDTAYFASFRYFTFIWSGGDPDGDETVAGYQWYLGDSSMRPADLDTVTWNRLDSLTTSYTFTDLQPGFYRFFIRNYDIAGAVSPVEFYPDTLRGAWEVKEQIGNILYVDDNVYFFSSESIFTNILDSLYPAGYSTLNFEKRTFFYLPDIDSTLSLFDIVIWNAGSDRHLIQAAGGITAMVQNGGHLMINLTYSSRDTVIHPFLPMRAVTRTNIDRPMFFTIPAGYDTIRGWPDTSIQVYPDTLYATVPLSFTFGFAPAKPQGISGSGYEVLYVTAGETTAVRFPAYEITDPQPAKVVMFSFAVFDCNGNNNFRNMFANILQSEFR